MRAPGRRLPFRVAAPGRECVPLRTADLTREHRENDRQSRSLGRLRAAWKARNTSEYRKWKYDFSNAIVPLVVPAIALTLNSVDGKMIAWSAVVAVTALYLLLMFSGLLENIANQDAKTLKTKGAEPHEQVMVFTIAEVAAEWKVGEEVIKKEICDGRLSAFQVSKSVRVRREDMEAYQAANRVVPTPPTALRRRWLHLSALWH